MSGHPTRWCGVTTPPHGPHIYNEGGPRQCNGWFSTSTSEPDEDSREGAR